MPLGLAAVDLKLAMRQSGCPICRVRDEAEYRYLYFLLWENVNDGATRIQIIASLGFCPKHTWQMGHIETQHFGDALGNSIIYESLVEVVHNRLARYLRRAENGRRSAARRWLHRLLHRAHRLPGQDELRPKATCRVCQTRAQTERAHLRWLLEGLSDLQSKFREWYLHSERLCFQHLHQALELAEPQTEAGAMFLAGDALGYLSALRADLDEYGGKHAWDRRREEMTEAEKGSSCARLRLSSNC